MSLRKLSILLIPTLAVCFLIGFLIGAYPQVIRKISGKDSDALLLLTSDARLIPAQFLLDYEKATGHAIEVVHVESYHLFRTEAQKADLLFAPLSWMAQFSEILKTLPEQEKFKDLLSTDFQTLKLDVDFFLPVLWKTEQRNSSTHLLIWGFASPKEPTDGQRDFLSYLLTSETKLKEWAPQVKDYSFTLQITDTLPVFPVEQRAQKFREVSLPSLIIEQRPRN